MFIHGYYPAARCTHASCHLTLRAKHAVSLFWRSIRKIRMNTYHHWCFGDWLCLKYVLSGVYAYRGQQIDPSTTSEASDWCISPDDGGLSVLAGSLSSRYTSTLLSATSNDSSFISDWLDVISPIVFCSFCRTDMRSDAFDCRSNESHNGWEIACHEIGVLASHEPQPLTSYRIN